MAEQGHELGGRLGLQVRIGLQFGVLIAEAIQTAGRRIDLVLIMLTVRDVVFVHVAHEERAIGSVGAVERTEADVFGPHRDALVGRHVGRAFRDAFGVRHGVMQRIEGEEVTLILRGQRRAFDESAEVGETRDLRQRTEDGQLPERIGRARRTELAGIDALLEVDAALDVVPAAGGAAVVAGIHAAVAVELEAEGIARAFAEDVVFPGLRMVAPDHAAFEMDRGGVRGIETRADHAGGRRAAMHAVEPAVRTQDDAVADRVRVLKTEAGEMHHRGAVGNVIAVGIGVEQQVRRIHHPDAAMGAHGGIGHIQPVLEDRMLIVDPVALRRLMDGDDIGAAVMVRRSRRHAVVVRAIILIAADHVHAGGIGILAILRDPKPAAGVETEVRRLGDLRLRKQEIHREIGRRAHLGVGVGR